MESSKENFKEDKFISKGVRFHENCKIQDGGPSMKQAKTIPPQAVLNTFVCPRFEDM